MTEFLLFNNKKTCDDNKENYHIARQSRGRSRHSDGFLNGSYFAIWIIFPERVISHVFLFIKANKFKII